jgi:GT2 family glycosyltransferase
MAVGVVVPVHGFAAYLAEALDSVLANAPDAVVVVDDGSDPPFELDPEHRGRVTLVRRDTAGGPAVARAAALDALGPDVDLVALCDADDAWAPGSLDARVQALRAAGPRAGWCFGRALVIGPDDRPTGERWDEPAPGLHEAAAFGRTLYDANPVPTSSVIVRRDVLDDAGGFPGPAPVPVAEDWDLWLRLCHAGWDAVCVPEAVVRYRRHPGGLTADVAGLARAQLAVHRAHGDLVGEHQRRAAEAADFAALAAGLVRAGDVAGARAAWAEVAARRRLRAAEHARRAALAVPVLRTRTGRADPYRRGNRASG